ncbi:NADH-ubiquinone oxidoreductase B8 subunit [Artemisia annua]|uniref:NADH-ubiquinone oxidoreductase B8 subunit n=1 Tax=Artemisia annua TaxID=35608 RepID=A0A2U1N1Q0_ARTAN|nr:NADH-ubiquinone oxidoreductase B8 subunit [Artemisia annua]
MARLGQLSKNIKELRVLFCQSSPASSSTRAFVEKNYTELKKANPKLPILIRECSGTQPQLWARYAMSEKVNQHGHNCSQGYHAEKVKERLLGWEIESEIVKPHLGGPQPCSRMLWHLAFCLDL